MPTTHYATSVINDGPAAYYRLGDLSTSRVAYDFSFTGTSPNCANGAYSNIDVSVPGALTSDSDTAVETLSNSHSNVAMTAGDQQLPSGSTPPTVEFWLNPSGGGPSTYTVVGYGSDFSISVQNAGGFPDADRVLISGNGSTTTVPTPNANFLWQVSSWHLLDIAYDGSQMNEDSQVNVYVDGQLQGSAPFKANTDPSTAGLTLGKPGTEGFQYDELAIYPKALSPAAIESHFTAASAAPPPPPPPIVDVDVSMASLG
jgi:hypothetical protein